MSNYTNIKQFDKKLFMTEFINLGKNNTSETFTLIDITRIIVKCYLKDHSKKFKLSLFFTETSKDIIRNPNNLSELEICAINCSSMYLLISDLKKKGMEKSKYLRVQTDLVKSWNKFISFVE